MLKEYVNLIDKDLRPGDDRDGTRADVKHMSKNELRMKYIEYAEILNDIEEGKCIALDDREIQDIRIQKRRIGLEMGRRDHWVKHDLVEDTEEYKAVVEVVDELAMKRVKELGLAIISHRFCYEKKRILKEEYGIDWRSVIELNPWRNVD